MSYLLQDLISRVLHESDASKRSAANACTNFQEAQMLYSPPDSVPERKTPIYRPFMRRIHHFRALVGETRCRYR
jgi:hypothetical protein